MLNDIPRGQTRNPLVVSQEFLFFANKGGIFTVLGEMFSCSLKTWHGFIPDIHGSQGKNQTL